MEKAENENSEFSSGFIAIVGPPNVGKSTLLNQLLGEKVTIVSPKPQTTRNRILGIYHGSDYQLIFMDTPGMHKTSTPLHRSMVLSAQEALSEVDMLILVIDVKRPDDKDIISILQNIKKVKKPAILVINKIDLGSKDLILPVMEDYSFRYPFDAIIPVSALLGDGVKVIIEELRARIKPGPQFFPKDMTTDQPEEFLVSEVIREKVYLYTRKELPYSTAVIVKKMEEIPGKKLLSISAVLNVETESQKAIIIGEKGSTFSVIIATYRRPSQRLEECVRALAN